MKSTNIIFDIIDKYGHDEKQKLMIELKNLRRQVVKEVSLKVRDKARELASLSNLDSELYEK